MIQHLIPTQHPAISVAASEAGQGSVCCVLIHGFGEGSFVWYDLVARIQSTFRVVLVDLRGHGCSDWDPDGRYDIETFISDVLCILTALDICPVVFIGHSMGGLIAARAATKLGVRASGLILVDFAPKISPDARASIRRTFRSSLQSYVSTTSYWKSLRATRPLASLGFLSILVQYGLQRDEDGIYRVCCDPQLLNMNIDPLRDDEFRPAMRTLTCPTLVVRGAFSSVLRPEDAEQLAICFVNGELTTVPKAGHGVMVDNPAGFAAAVLPFLKRLLAIR